MTDDKLTKKLWALGLAIVAPGIVALATAVGAYWLTTARSQARAEEIHTRLTRDLQLLQGAQARDSSALDHLARDLAGVQATVEAGTESTLRRLDRIESGLERIREGR
jgi:hypothetical protein